MEKVNSKRITTNEKYKDHKMYSDTFKNLKRDDVVLLTINGETVFTFIVEYGHDSHVTVSGQDRGAAERSKVERLEYQLKLEKEKEAKNDTSERAI